MYIYNIYYNLNYNKSLIKYLKNFKNNIYILLMDNCEIFIIIIFLILCYLIYNNFNKTEQFFPGLAKTATGMMGNKNIATTAIAGNDTATAGTTAMAGTTANGIMTGGNTMTMRGTPIQEYQPGIVHQRLSENSSVFIIRQSNGNYIHRQLMVGDVFNNNNGPKITAIESTISSKLTLNNGGTTTFIYTSMAENVGMPIEGYESGTIVNRLPNNSSIFTIKQNNGNFIQRQLVVGDAFNGPKIIAIETTATNNVTLNNGNTFTFTHPL